MSSTTIFYAIGDLITWTFGLYENVGNLFNYSVILLGFFGLYFWLNKQIKFNAKSKNDPSQRK
jgi:hypothetical protein